MKVEKQYTNYALELRMYPNQEQQILLSQFFGSSRYVYNRALDLNIKQYQKDKTFIWYYDLAKELPKLKKQEETSWLKSIDGTCLQQSLKHFDRALKEFCKSKRNQRKGEVLGFPKFKNKNSKQSITLMMVNDNIKLDLDNGFIKIPKIKSKISIISDKRKPIGKITSITIKKNPSGKYFVSILFQQEKSINNYIADPNKSIGLDFGLKDFITDSNGNKISAPKPFQKLQKKLAKMQREYSRKKTNSDKSPSKNKLKLKLKIAYLYEKITNQRKDFNHKLSRQLVNQYDFIFIENLNIKGMSRGRKRKDPNAKTRKRGLGKAVNDLAWSQFVSFLMYKAISEGKFVIKIDRYFPSSQLCSHCGYKNSDLKLSDREWICPQCGQVHDRDVNAAINILNEGKRLIT